VVWSAKSRNRHLHRHGSPRTAVKFDADKRQPSDGNNDGNSYQLNGNAHHRGKVRLATLSQLDRRCQAFKVCAAIIAGLTSDAGGESEVTVAMRQLIQRAALLAAWIEDAEVRWMQNSKLDIDAYVAAVNCQRRVLRDIGWTRRPRELNELGADIESAYTAALESDDDEPAAEVAED
jgi:hypothetical protein